MAILTGLRARFNFAEQHLSAREYLLAKDYSVDDVEVATGNCGYCAVVKGQGGTRLEAPGGFGRLAEGCASALVQ